MTESSPTDRAEQRDARREADRAHGRAARLALRPLLVAAGAYHLLLGLFQAVAPEQFFEKIASYGAYNDHYLRDTATFYLALGIVLMVAAVRRSWQVPVLAFTVVQYLLHVVNHIVDIADSEPGWHGPVNAITLALIGIALFWLLRTAQIEEKR